MSKAWTRDWVIRRWRRAVIRASWKVGGKPRLIMQLSRASAAVASACVAVLLMCAPGCATTPKPIPLPSQEVRASLGKVGVISVGVALDGTVSGPVGVGHEIGKGALRGGAIGGLGLAGTGALLGLGCGPCAPACVPAFASLGAVGGLVLGGSTGAIYHGVTAIPESTAMEIVASFSRIVTESDIQSDLRMRVIGAGRVNGPIDLGIGRTGDPVPMPDYTMVATRGVNTVLEVGISQMVLAGEGGRDPAFVLTIIARARLIRVADDVVLWSDDQFAFNSPSADFSVWSADNYALLKMEFANGLDALARDIAGKVFGTGTYAAISG
jgi:hypothetical protein